MVKIIDHAQTGKSKFITGGGRKRDIPLELLDDPKNKKEKTDDKLLKKVSAVEFENQKERLKSVRKYKKKYSTPKKNKDKKKKVPKIVKSFRRTTGLFKSMRFKNELDKEKVYKSLKDIETVLERNLNV
jgi:hypothetical protein